MNRVFRIKFGAVRRYSSALSPTSKTEYVQYVTQWTDHFKTCDEDFELERGLNHVFAADWAPSVELVAEALRASRRLNSFATAVRILEGVKDKTDPNAYSQYTATLEPLLRELGIVERSALGEFKTYRDRNPWTE